MSGIVNEIDSRSHIISGKDGTIRAHCSWNQYSFAEEYKFNVASITDDTTGRVTVTFTHNMPTTDYCVVGNCGDGNAGLGAMGMVTKLVGSVTLTMVYQNGTEKDFPDNSMAVIV